MRLDDTWVHTTCEPQSALFGHRSGREFDTFQAVSTSNNTQTQKQTQMSKEVQASFDFDFWIIAWRVWVCSIKHNSAWPCCNRAYYCTDVEDLPKTTLLYIEHHCSILSFILCILSCTCLICSVLIISIWASLVRTRRLVTYWTQHKPPHSVCIGTNCNSSSTLLCHQL